MLVLGLGGGLRDDDVSALAGWRVTLNFANLYVMIQCGEPKVQEQKNGNNTRFVRTTDEQRET